MHDLVVCPPHYFVQAWDARMWFKQVVGSKSIHSVYDGIKHDRYDIFARLKVCINNRVVNKSQKATYERNKFKVTIPIRTEKMPEVLRNLEVFPFLSRVYFGN